jgi:hypothetical protein
MRERMSAALRDQFQVEDDEEWRLIYERIERVSELRRSAGAGGPRGGAMAFRAARAAGGGGEAADQADHSNGQGHGEAGRTRTASGLAFIFHGGFPQNCF